MNTIQYTLMTWMPTLLNGLGYDTSQSQFMTVFGLFGAPFGIFVASLIMDRVPRKLMGILLLVGMAAFGIAIGAVTSAGHSRSQRDWRPRFGCRKRGVPRCARQ